MPDNRKTADDLQGITRLVADATIGVTDLVEDMHRQVVHPPLLPSTPVQNLITGIAGLTYSTVRWSTRLVAYSLDKMLGTLGPVLGKMKTTEEREAFYSALNGVVGDHLVLKENPLAIDMQFRYLSRAVTFEENILAELYPKVTGKVLLMIHGSCMNDIQWTRKGHNHGLKLAQDLDKTPLYLHYNSGRHIFENGKDLNQLLEELIQHWSVPIEELVIVAHSMGGLVARSALHYAHKQQKTWTKALKKIVFLGTPHHGAPLERTGSYIDLLLESVPYAKPFARLGKIRSAGVTDLRYGNISAEDRAEGQGRFEVRGDTRQEIALPKGPDYYSIAAVLGKESDSGFSQTVGDGLVTVQSALGQHKDPAKNLNFKESNTWIAYENSHLDLLNNPDVYVKLKSWLS